MRWRDEEAAAARDAWPARTTAFEHLSASHSEDGALFTVEVQEWRGVQFDGRNFVEAHFAAEFPDIELDAPEDVGDRILVWTWEV